MESLLQKIQEIEQGAHALIQQAEESKRTALQDISTVEKEALEHARTRSEQKGQQILSEAVAKAKQEAHQILQDDHETVQKIHEVGKQQRSAATATLIRLFTETYSG